MEKTRVLLYKKTDRWQIWVCLLATILLFVCAIALVHGEPAAGLPMTTNSDPVTAVAIVSDPAEPPPPAAQETPEASPPPETQYDVQAPITFTLTGAAY